MESGVSPPLMAPQVPAEVKVRSSSNGNEEVKFSNHQVNPVSCSSFGGYI